MAKANDLTPEAISGYEGKANAYLATSAAWYAHQLGAHLLATGRCAPADVRMGRGYRIRCGDMVFAFDKTDRISREQ